MQCRQAKKDFVTRVLDHSSAPFLDDNVRT